MLDVVLVADLDYNELDLVSYAVRSALKNCTLPDLKINFNSVSNEYSVEILDETKKTFEGINIPHIFLMGVVNGNYYFDMTFGEYKSLDSCFLAVVSSKGKILEFEKLGKFFALFRVFSQKPESLH